MPRQLPIGGDVTIAGLMAKPPVAAGEGHTMNVDRLDTVPVSAIVTAYRRIEQTLETLRRIEACRPRPDEILVHVDGNQTTCFETIHHAFPHLRILLSEVSVGAGGGRNRLVSAAGNELIATFDDDSYPLDSDYFARVVALCSVFPDAGAIGAAIIHRGEAATQAAMQVTHTCTYISCGAVLRRSIYLAVGGYVEVDVPYGGMEEGDLALRLQAAGHSVLDCAWLRVFHDTDLSHHDTPTITAGTIRNVALHAWLRYPIRYLPYGVLQLANRVAWSVRHGRLAGVLAGMLTTPHHLWRHRHLRQPVSASVMRQRFATRSSSPQPFTVEPDTIGA